MLNALRGIARRDARGSVASRMTQLGSINVDSLARELASVLRRHLDGSRTEAPNELTPDEVAKRLRKSRSWVYARMSSGELPFVQVSPSRRIIRAADLEAFLIARRAA